MMKPVSTVRHVKLHVLEKQLPLQGILPERSKLVTGEIEIDKETCIDCGICEEMCPADAITMEAKFPTSDDPTFLRHKCGQR